MRQTKTTILFIVLILLSKILSGQEIAITERGDSVILYSDGTWEYYANYPNNSEEVFDIKANYNIYTKPNSSKTKINGKNQAYEIWYDNNKWKRVPVGELNPAADIALKLINGDAYAMIIYEELEIPIKTLSQVAVTNAANAAPDIRMVDRDYRIVNSDTLIWMRMDGTTQGIKISYSSYYCSNKNGSIQFHTFTGQSIIDKYKDDMDDLLNGLIIIE